MFSHVNKSLSRYRSIWVPFLFALMAYLSVFYLAASHVMFFNNDFIHEYFRLVSIHRVLSRGMLPHYGFSFSGIHLRIIFPWLFFIPLSFLTLMFKPVALFYVLTALILFLIYMVSYFSCRIVDKKISHSLLFALLYTNSSVVFNWWSHEGDLANLLMSVFMPMAFFGMICLFKRGRLYMFAIGMLLVLFCQVINGTMFDAILLILVLLHAHKLIWKRLFFALAAFLFVAEVSSFIWLPITSSSILPRLMFNTTPHAVSSGVLTMLGSSCDYLFGITDIVGIASIAFIHNRHFNSFDVELWIIGILLLLFNVTSISSMLVHIFPVLTWLQYSYRFTLISHFIFTYLAFMLLIGRFSFSRYYNERILTIFVVFLILIMPVFDQVNTRFLLSDRDMLTVRNSDYLLNNHIHTMHHDSESQFKFSNQSFFVYYRYYHG